MHIITKRLRPESSAFRYKVALYFSYLRIKFDDEIKENPLEFQAQFVISLRPKLYWRVCYPVSTVRISF